jgi:PelA/Pel-15E family pectate lyase
MDIAKSAYMLKIVYFLAIALLLTIHPQKKAAATNLQVQKDTIAERMLLFQRSNGGWAQYRGDPTDYTKPLTNEFRATLRKDKNKLDATIDDKSTTKEIHYLVAAYSKTKNSAYLEAAERGIRYLLSMQYENGGFPQRFPDTSGYHKHITYNDQAMIDALKVLKLTADKHDAFGALDASLAEPARKAVEKGVVCLLKTQYTQNGILTAWGAQHDNVTLQPAAARKFEPASLSSSESLGVIYFLIDLPDPRPEIRKSVAAAVAWLESVKIPGYALERIQDANQPVGRDNVVISKPGAVMWARFYELGTNRPIFIGRDAIIKYKLEEIENERRVGYSWYNTRPEKLIAVDYPNWKKKWGNN